AVFARFDVDRAAVKLDERPREPETEAERAVTARARRIAEGLEDFFALERDARAAVGLDVDAKALAFRGNRRAKDDAPLRDEMHRARHDRHERADETDGVGVDLGNARLDLGGDFDLRGRG